MNSNTGMYSYNYHHNQGTTFPSPQKSSHVSILQSFSTITPSWPHCMVQDVELSCVWVLFHVSNSDLWSQVFGSCGKGPQRYITCMSGEIQGEAELRWENILSGPLPATETASERWSKGGCQTPGTACLEYMLVQIGGLHFIPVLTQKSRGYRLAMPGEVKPHWLNR